MNPLSLQHKKTIHTLWKNGAFELLGSVGCNIVAVVDILNKVVAGQIVGSAADMPQYATTLGLVGLSVGLGALALRKMLRAGSACSL